MLKYISFLPWVMAAVVGAVALSVLWKLRAKIWLRRVAIGDYLAALAIVGTALYFVAGELLASLLQDVNFVVGVYAVSFAMILAWAFRTVRASGWLPQRPLVEMLWIIPATPALLLPAVARNAARSIAYAGLVLFFLELCGLFYYFIHPGGMLAFAVLSLVGLFGAGIARLYGATFNHLQRWAPPYLCALGALVLWPLALATFLLVLAWSMVCNLLASLLVLLAPAILLYIVGTAFDSQGIKAAAVLLPLLGLLPGVASLLLAGAMPTGFGDGGGSGGFDLAFNPANGLPMFDGMGGVDIMGNPFGTDFNHH